MYISYTFIFFSFMNTSMILSCALSFPIQGICDNSLIRFSNVVVALIIWMFIYFPLIYLSFFHLFFLVSLLRDIRMKSVSFTTQVKILEHLLSQIDDDTKVKDLIYI